MSKPTNEDVTAFLRDRVSKRTKVAPEDIARDTVLVDIGLQSVDAVLICGEIEDTYEIEVEPALMFEYRTLGEVADAVIALFDTQ